MRRFLVEGPRGEHFTRITISGADEDEDDIAEAILFLLSSLDCTLFNSIEPRDEEDE